MFADIFFQTDPNTGREMLRAMPAMLGILCVVAIAYRYYSAFLAAKVMAFDDSRITPAHRFDDGQNYHPTNRWVLFGHHFAAISGAGPLIGPVLAMQYGYAPGLIWLLVGVCLAGAVQDMLVLAVSTRTDGKSLAEIARVELGKSASIVASVAILFIVIIALAGLAFIIVKALGGEDAKLPSGMTVHTPPTATALTFTPVGTAVTTDFPKGCRIAYKAGDPASTRSEGFRVRFPEAPVVKVENDGSQTVTMSKACVQVIPGSSWGTFTIAMTIPIALFVGWWMYRVRKGRITEASIIGGLAVLGAVVAGAWIPGSSLEPFFALSRESAIITLCIYGFIAAVLPVWLLLTPRDYLSSFMKIGTLALLIVGVILANPVLRHPPLNETFRAGGPTFPGGLFPFVFICIMCGSISGFHALVSSGTTPKMVNREHDIRPIGYGAMLLEGLVAVVALISAAAMQPRLYYEINVDVEKVPAYEKQLAEMYATLGDVPGANEPIHKVGVTDLHQLDLAQIEESVGGESLRGRTGGAVTLAVSMAMILTKAFSWADDRLMDLMQYWYHFAIMFEALFILTTIDAGTRIARYLFQETAGKVYAPLGRPDSWIGAFLATGTVTAGWGLLVYTGQIGTIWPMFGIANQLLAVMALALVTTWLVNHGRGRYAWVTIAPMLFVTTTTLTAGRIMIGRQLANIELGKDVTVNSLNLGLTLFVIVSVCTLVLMAASRWLTVWIQGRKSHVG